MLAYFDAEIGFTLGAQKLDRISNIKATCTAAAGSLSTCVHKIVFRCQNLSKT